MKTVLITGGSKGIGLGIAKVLLKAGMKVAITGRNSDTVQQAAADLKSEGYEHVLAIQSDVRKLADEEAAVAKVVDYFGSLDVVIANAGIGAFAPIDEMTSEQWNDVIDINLTGVFNSTKAAIPALKKSEGYLITIASLAGANFFAKGTAYNASKFGLVGFSQAAMLDLRPYNIKVTTIMPGSVASYFNGHVPNDKDAWKIQPEDIGKLCEDLLSMNPRTLPSKIEVRPSRPDLK